VAGIQLNCEEDDKCQPKTNNEKPSIVDQTPAFASLLPYFARPLATHGAAVVGGHFTNVVRRHSTDALPA
jgi:hypothetical protein